MNGRVGKKRRGVVLVYVMWMTVVFGGIAVGLLIVSMSHSKQIQSTFELTRALLAAETGLERQLEVLNHSNVMGGEGLGVLMAEHRGAAFEVRTTAWWLDGQDNDINGEVDDAAENNYMTVEAIGTVARVERRVRATVLKGTVDFPPVRGAVTLYNPVDENGDVIPGALVNFSGSPPRISGQDSALPAGVGLENMKAKDVVIGSGDGGDVLAVAVHDDESVADLLNALGKKEERLDGLDPTGMDDEELEDALMNGGGPIGTGSVANVGAFDPLGAADIYSLANELSAFADNDDVYGDGNWPAGDITLGTLSDPQVTVLRPSEGSAKALNGRVSGSGVLIIDGHVRISGTFTYAGLVIITARGLAEVDLAGTPLVMGAIIGANPDSDMQPRSTVLDLRGTADVYYCSEALGLSEQVFGGKTQVLSQNEF